MRHAIKQGMQISPEDQQSASWQVASKEELLAHLQTSEQGLTTQEAQRRLSTCGPNAPVTVQRAGMLFQLIRLFLNPLVMILLLAGLVSASLGDSVNAIIIVIMVLLGVGLNFIQTYTSQRAVERLRAGVAPTATVLRDGIWKEGSREKPPSAVELQAW